MLLPIPPTPHRRRPPNRAAVLPPGPPIAHVIGIDRLSQTILRFTFDTAISDPGACGDLRVSDQPPTANVLVDDYTLDLTYPDMANGNPWTAHVIDGEPIFANNAVLADNGGTVPVWA